MPFTKGMVAFFFWKQANMFFRCRPQHRRLNFDRLENRCVLNGLPVLHSFPGAEHTIYLDFDGHRTERTSWNIAYPVIESTSFDVDGKPDSFSDEEVARITSIWERMAEDFRPFRVDVTTVDPSLQDTSVFERSGVAQRVVFTNKYDQITGQRWFQGDNQGAATDSWYRVGDTPAWVFSSHHLAGEIGSHEVGHAVGLTHDSALLPDGTWIEYRGEHGQGETRWSPIMGQGNGLSQWSRGDYPHATNPQLDLGVLDRAFGRRPDDFPGITNLAFDSSHGKLSGVIEHSGDHDLFAIQIDTPGRLRIDVTPWHSGPNLDIGSSLLSANGATFVGLEDPQANPQDLLSSSIQVDVPPGQFYLQIQGVGKRGTAEDPGYSDYGSLGYYEINFLHTPRDTEGSGKPGDFNRDDRVDFADFLILSQHYGNHEVAWYQGDMNGDRQVDWVDWEEFATRFESP